MDQTPPTGRRNSRPDPEDAGRPDSHELGALVSGAIPTVAPPSASPPRPRCEPPFDFDALWNRDPSDDPQLAAALIARGPRDDGDESLSDVLYRMRGH